VGVPSGEGKKALNRQEKDAFVYAKDKIERAQAYISALQQRRRTLYATMRAIIDFQLPFFVEGDENLLRPMVLKDIAERTGLDISTISRVCNSKYCQTRWGIFRLRYFFSEGVKTADGEQLSVHQVKNAMQEIIDEEDKRHPLSDDAIAALMKQRGFPIARRTVAKYREQLGIPVARMRKI
jgi:RNA polymerase sigma-54 factor